MVTPTPRRNARRVKRCVLISVGLIGMMESPNPRRAKERERRIWRKDGQAGFDSLCGEQAIKWITMDPRQFATAVDGVLIEGQRLDLKKFQLLRQPPPRRFRQRQFSSGMLKTNLPDAHVAEEQIV